MEGNFLSRYNNRVDELTQNFISNTKKYQSQFLFREPINKKYIQMKVRKCQTLTMYSM